MKRLKSAGPWLLAICVAVAGTVAQAGSAPRVVADIAPVHSLVAQVMDGVGEPELLLRAGASPHDYSMKPSEARMLNMADIVVWTGAVLTPWLRDAMDVLAPDADRITFSDLEGVTLLPFRTGALFDAHDHNHEQDHGAVPETDDHAEGQGIDPHLWLDPRNAAALVSELALALAERDPDNAGRYRSNAERTLDELARLEADIGAAVSPVRTRPFLVFHDAYHYFEARFDIPASGAVSLGDGVKPGARRIRELQTLIQEQGIVCVFAEPQFEPALLRRLTAGTEVRTGVLDPVGAGIDPGSDHYEYLLRAMADGLSECLSP